MFVNTPMFCRRCHLKMENQENLKKYMEEKLTSVKRVRYFKIV